MEEDGESVCRSAQKAESDNEGANTGSSPPPEVPTAASDKRMVRKSSVYESVAPASCSNTPTSFVSHHVTPASSRKKRVVHGASCYGFLAPALLIVLLLTCIILQSALIFLRVTGKSREATRDDRVIGNSSHLSVSNHTQQERSPRCPDLWIPINDKCYFFSESQKSRIDSDKDCEEQGSSLATVKEKTIRRLVTITGKEFWVGLIQYNIHDESWTGKWTDGSMEIVNEGTGSCAKLGSHLMLENCYAKLNWICERDTV